jgi:hypothetical protein
MGTDGATITAPTAAGAMLPADRVRVSFKAYEYHRLSYCWAARLFVSQHSVVRRYANWLNQDRSFRIEARFDPGLTLYVYLPSCSSISMASLPSRVTCKLICHFWSLNASQKSVFARSPRSETTRPCFLDLSFITRQRNEQGISFQRSRSGPACQTHNLAFHRNSAL